MPRTILALTALTIVAAPAARAADSWGLENERPLELSGKVVDLLCELTGDCAADRGGGRRQLGILTADGRLFPAVKGTVFFAGAAPDLLPHCGQTVHADGLLIENPAMTLYFAQYLKATPDAAWAPTDTYLTQWTLAHGNAEEWRRADPTVKAVIARDGLLGIPGLKPE
jgi:hypothetical protein